MEMAVATRPTTFRIARYLCGLLALGGLMQAPTPAGATARWVINPQQTHIIFAIDAVGYPRTLGEFRQFEGWIEVDLERPDKSSVAVHALSRSVDVGSRSFDDFVRSEGFLNAARYPSIDFVSNAVERIDDHTVRVSGNLTLLGVTRPLAVDVAVQKETGGANQRLRFKAQTRINRLEYGMKGGFPLVSRDVELVISSEAAEL
jgi:polyisoprenoid-binding protein YceI